MNTNAFQKINEFFETYANALENYDTKHMAFHYQMPCLFITESASNVFTEASKLEGMFNQGTAFYKQYGIINSRPEVLAKNFLSDKICRVKVMWEYFDKDNQPLYNCEYQYILRKDKNDHWKIDVSIAINEKEKMDEWLASRGKK